MRKPWGDIHNEGGFETKAKTDRNVHADYAM